jgi:hypothetical protein
MAGREGVRRRLWFLLFGLAALGLGVRVFGRRRQPGAGSASSVR